MDALTYSHLAVLANAARFLIPKLFHTLTRSARRHAFKLAFIPVCLALTHSNAWSEPWQNDSSGGNSYGWQARSPRAYAQRSVTVNGKLLTEQVLATFERHYHVRIASGDYWYDRVSGAWGVMGGPTLGLILPNLNLGGPLRSDASNGNTGVFINGRQLHVLDVLALQQIVPFVLPGRYWVNAQGYGGYEGGPAWFNLVQLAQAAGGRRGGAWSYTSKYTGASVGGDGDFFYYIDKDSSYTSGR